MPNIEISSLFQLGNVFNAAPKAQSCHMAETKKLFCESKVSKMTLGCDTTYNLCVAYIYESRNR